MEDQTQAARGIHDAILGIYSLAVANLWPISDILLVFSITISGSQAFNHAFIAPEGNIYN